MDRFMKGAGLVVAGCALTVSAAQADVPEDYFFVDAFAVSHDERIPDAELGLGARIGVGGQLARSPKSRVGVELGLFGNPIRSSGSSGDSQKGLMVDLVQQFMIGNWTPYIFAGAGGVLEKIGPAKGLYPALEAGGGVMFTVGKANVRTGLSAMSVRNDELDEGKDAYVDLRFNVGLMWSTGTAAAAPVARRVLDSDGDGLADEQDKCPTTPASTADGCPVAAPVVQTDSDGDGVYDSQDTCAGTLSGLKVDASGCAVQTETQSVVLKGVTFLPGSATLTADAKTVLDGAAASLSADKSLKVELGGYTDSQGKDAANLALSQKRADSARQYLISKGVEGERLTAKGYGEASPIADNNTVEGRAENRRVELKVVR